MCESGKEIKEVEREAPRALSPLNVGTLSVDAVNGGEHVWDGGRYDW